MPKKTKNKDFLVLLFGLASLNAMSIYVLFRIWTIYESIGVEEGLMSQIIIILFFVTELFIVLNAIGYFINIVTSMYRYERSGITYANIKDWPKVTVFLPMINEPISVITKTFIAATYIDYPNYEIVVVDSSTEEPLRSEIEKQAKAYGLTYFPTPYPQHGAKAGAMNEAMKVYDTPYYAVFDADYRASRDFLKLLVAQMIADSKLGFIQTPQFYGNHSSSPVARIAQIQQSIFYEYISEGKSVHNGMFLCGTNLVVRKKALDSIGGWDEHVITEDFSTSIALAGAGWKTRFYSLTTAFGDGPQNLTEYFKQQYRWSRGTFESYFKHFKLMLGSKLDLWQKIEYSLSGFYFFVGFVWMFLISMPLLYIFFQIPGYQTDPLLFTIAYLPYAVLSFMFFIITMRYRYFKISDLLKAQSLTLLTLPVYIKAFINLLIGKKATFESVKKDSTYESIHWKAMPFQLIIIALNVIAVFWGLWSIPTSSNLPALLQNIFWAFFHSVLMLYLIISLYVYKEE